MRPVAAALLRFHGRPADFRAALDSENQRPGRDSRVVINALLRGALCVWLGLTLIAVPASARAEEAARELGSPVAEPAQAASEPQEAASRSEPDAGVRIALTLAYGLGGYVAGVGLAAILTFLFAGYDLGGGIASGITVGAGSVLYAGLGGSALVLGVQQGARQGGGRPQAEFIVLGAFLGALPGAGLLVGGGLAQSPEAASVGAGLLFIGPLIGATIGAEGSNRAGHDDDELRAEPVFRVSAEGAFVGIRGAF